ncbi:UNVERIFIED_CONTAM: protein ABIL3 [Sesamum angustifolium]|uniref:Protein ABIL3 n=1 Tax=Sesamum angustifolium TaxID=2727405 RepID=A0AAW2M5C8_9LAMI
MGSDTITPSQKASNYDEISMQNSLHFADSLKDLKNLRKQLYTAAEYFESSYGKNDHKQLVIESSKDYVAKALVSTVDHLGSVADKLNRFLDEKAKEFAATKIRFSCIEQVAIINQCALMLEQVDLLNWEKFEKPVLDFQHCFLFYTLQRDLKTNLDMALITNLVQ